MTVYYYKGKFSSYLDDEYIGLVVKYSYEESYSPVLEEGHGYHYSLESEYSLSSISVVTVHSREEECELELSDSMLLYDYYYYIFRDSYRGC